VKKTLIIIIAVILVVLIVLFKTKEKSQIITERIEYEVIIDSTYSNNIKYSDSIIDKWMAELFTSLQNGETKAFSLNPNSTTIEFEEITSYKDSNKITFDHIYFMRLVSPDFNYDEPYDILDTMITESKVANHKNIVGFRFMEQWSRYGSGKIVKEVIAFAPLYYESFLYKPLPLFWIKEHKSQNHLNLTLHYDVEIKQYREDHNWFIDNILASGRLNWMNDLFNDIKNGTTKTFELSSNNSLYEFKEVDTDSIFITRNRTIKVLYKGDGDHSTGVIDTLIHEKTEVLPSDIYRVSFIEEWKFDKKGKFIKTVKSYAPISIFEREKYLLFWVSE